MLKTGELAADVGSVIDGEEAVSIGLIDELGGLSDALNALHQMIDEASLEKQGEQGEQSPENDKNDRGRNKKEGGGFGEEG